MSSLPIIEVFVLVLVLAASATVALVSLGNPAAYAIEHLSPRFVDRSREASLRRKRGGTTRAFLQRIDITRKLEQSMWQAGIYMRVSELLLLMVGLFGTVEVIAGVLIDVPVLAFVAGVAAAALPIPYIRFRMQRRVSKFAAQLPHALELIKSLLEAGHSLTRGLQVVVAELEDPISSEFATVLEQTTLGLPLARSLEEMATRMPQDDVRLLVVAVKVQAEVGSSLAQIIGRLSELMRTRERLKGQIRSLTAQSRMSGMIVGLLPVMVLAAFSLVQPGYAHNLFYDPTGVKMLEAALVLDLMALVTIRQLLKVKY